MVQAELVYPKDNMIHHSIVTEHQPGDRTDSLQYFSGKILEAFQGSDMESATQISLSYRKRAKGNRCALGQTEDSCLSWQ